MILYYIWFNSIWYNIIYQSLSYGICMLGCFELWCPGAALTSTMATWETSLTCWELKGIGWTLNWCPIAISWFSKSMIKRFFPHQSNIAGFDHSKYHVQWLAQKAALIVSCLLRWGFCHIIRLLLKVVNGGLLFGGPPCGSWVFINRYTSGRTSTRVFGNCARKYVRESNVKLDLYNLFKVLYFHQASSLPMSSMETIIFGGRDQLQGFLPPPREDHCSMGATWTPVSCTCSGVGHWATQELFDAKMSLYHLPCDGGEACLLGQCGIVRCSGIQPKCEHEV